MVDAVVVGSNSRLVKHAWLIVARINKGRGITEGAQRDHNNRAVARVCRDSPLSWKSMNVTSRYGYDLLCGQYCDWQRGEEKWKYCLMIIDFLLFIVVCYLDRRCLIKFLGSVRMKNWEEFAVVFFFFFFWKFIKFLVFGFFFL